jgi:hypothetical protein
MKKLLSLFIIILCMSFISAATMTRTGPSTANPMSTFQITYTVTGSGSWGASIEDSVSGGCKFPDGTSSYKDVMLYTSGSSRSITITAPNSGTCVFTGNYKFSTDPIVNFASTSVSITNSCTPNCFGKCGGVSDGCSGSCNAACACIPDNSCMSSTCVGSTCTNNCGTILQGTKSCSSGCIPDNSCSLSTCIGQKCTNNCESSIDGIKDCSAGPLFDPDSKYCKTISKFNIFSMDDSCMGGTFALLGLILIGVVVISKI